MRTRIAIATGIVTLLATAAGCARPDVVSVATSPRPVVAYSVPTGGAASGASRRLARFEEAPAREAHVAFEEPHRH